MRAALSYFFSHSPILGYSRVRAKTFRCRYIQHDAICQHINDRPRRQVGVYIFYRHCYLYHPAEFAAKADFRRRKHTISDIAHDYSHPTKANNLAARMLLRGVPTRQERLQWAKASSNKRPVRYNLHSTHPLSPLSP